MRPVLPLLYTLVEGIWLHLMPQVFRGWKSPWLLVETNCLQMAPGAILEASRSYSVGIPFLFCHAQSLPAQAGLSSFPFFVTR